MSCNLLQRQNAGFLRSWWTIRRFNEKCFKRERLNDGNDEQGVRCTEQRHE